MRRLTDFEALSFDCYGTLIDWESGIAAALLPWLEGSGVRIEPSLPTSLRHRPPLELL